MEEYKTRDIKPLQEGPCYLGRTQRFFQQNKSHPVLYSTTVEGFLL